MARQPLDEEKTNYLAEVIGHPASMSGAMASVTTAAVLSVASGFGLAAVPVIFYMATTSIAALFLPSSPVFRAWIDKRKRGERREVQREELTQRIARVLDQPRGRDDAFWREVREYGNTYQRMRDRLSAITELVKSKNAVMSHFDLERLDDATVDFLRLVYARVTLRERMEAQDARDIERKLDLVARQAEEAATPSEKKKLESAAADLQRLLDRRRALPARDASTSAQLLTMSEAFEDLYHQLSSAGATVGTVDLGEFLHETTEKLRFEEEVDLEVDAELAAIDHRLRATRAAAAGRAR
jgi:Asp-tRNA(Asn)/Glu-tRNA(Gln) amidotransferase A subunit family amidase